MEGGCARSPSNEVFMPIMLEVSMKDLRDIEKREEEHRREWERSRVIKRCKSCGQPYSFEKGGTDPKECQSCRGDEGELIF